MSLPEPDEERIRSLGAALVGAPISQVFPARRGANNRVFRIRSGSDDFALKFYPLPDADDPRDRLGAEFAALRFLDGTRTPRAIAADASVPCGLYEWIEGAPIDDPGPAETDVLASFLADLLEPEGGGHLDVASHAPLRMRVLLDQIAERRTRLGAVPELAEFLDDDVRSVARGRRAGGPADGCRRHPTARTAQPQPVGLRFSQCPAAARRTNRADRFRIFRLGRPGENDGRRHAASGMPPVGDHAKPPVRRAGAAHPGPRSGL